MSRARRRFARRLVRAYARRSGIRAPIVQFSHMDGGAALMTLGGRGVIILGHRLLHGPRWVLCAIAAHEVGHVASRHPVITGAGRVLIVIALVASLFLPSNVARCAAMLGLIALTVLLYVVTEVQADRHATRLGTEIVRLRASLAGRSLLHRLVQAAARLSARPTPPEGALW